MRTSDASRADPGASAAASFAAILRERTHDIHREAERTGFIADLLRGRGSRRGYAIYLHSLLPVYEVMERQLRLASPYPAVSAFSDPRLFRGEALRRDLRALATDGALPTLPEAAAYAAAVEAQGAGIGLVAHAYARYLGDLSGGQILKPLLQRTLDLAPQHLGFYDFPDLDIASCKSHLRAGLDTIAPASPEAAVVADEAILAFRHTIAVSSAVSLVA